VRLGLGPMKQFSGMGLGCSRCCTGVEVRMKNASYQSVVTYLEITSSWTKNAGNCEVNMS
jgi:hypothetical protein